MGLLEVGGGLSQAVYGLWWFLLGVAPNVFVSFVIFFSSFCSAFISVCVWVGGFLWVEILLCSWLFGPLWCFGCFVAIALFLGFLTPFLIKSRGISPQPKEKKNRSMNLIPAALCWAVQKEQNRRTFEDKSRLVRNITDAILSKIYDWMFVSSNRERPPFPIFGYLIGTLSSCSFVGSLHVFSFYQHAFLSISHAVSLRFVSLFNYLIFPKKTNHIPSIMVRCNKDIYL